MFGQVARGEVRVLLHHLDGFPSSQFFQHHQWRAALDVPACPRVTQVVPMEVLDTDRMAGPPEIPRVDLLDASVQLFTTSENEALRRLQSASQHTHRIVV